ncbi:MAG TPA: AbrB/MazE/SpoVT family DNA-binding domain-containing protein [Gaiellaceae bacterium]|jgi:antitoxin component of MazEF toxin-antitoxin module
MRLVHLVKTGSSVAVTIPRAVLRERNWKRGDTFLLELLPNGLQLVRVDESAVAEAVRSFLPAAAPAKRRA